MTISEPINEEESPLSTVVLHSSPGTPLTKHKYSMHTAPELADLHHNKDRDAPFQSPNSSIDDYQHQKNSEIKDVHSHAKNLAKSKIEFQSYPLQFLDVHHAGLNHGHSWHSLHSLHYESEYPLSRHRATNHRSSAEMRGLHCRESYSPELLDVHNGLKHGHSWHSLYRETEYSTGRHRANQRSSLEARNAYYSDSLIFGHPTSHEPVEERSIEFFKYNIILHGPPGVGKSSVQRLILGQPSQPAHCETSTSMTRVTVTACGNLEAIDNNEIKTLVRKSKYNKESEVNEQTSNANRIFDFYEHHYPAGQPQFLDILPFLYLGPSHFIFVMRLDDGGLDNNPKIHLDKSQRSHYPERLMLTNEELILKTCQIAQSITQATSGKFMPKVFIIGTHKDKLLKIRRHVNLRNINDRLLKIRDQYHGVLVSKSASKVIFAFNTMDNDEKKRECYTQKIQQSILLETEKSGSLNSVPNSRWFDFYLELDKNEGMVRVSKCYEVGKNFGMEKVDVDYALEFLNQAALIFYCKADIPDLIVLKMDPITQMLSKLIQESFASSAKESKELSLKGVFKRSFLERVLADFQNRLISHDEFLKLLQLFKIIFRVKEEYFLPCALSIKSQLNDSSFDDGPTSLAFIWDDILPYGFFLSVAVELGRSNKDGFMFELSTDKAQSQGEIRLREAKCEIPGVVRLTDRKTWIQVSYSTRSDYCAEIYKAVKRASDRALDLFKDRKMALPTIGYLCPLCKGGDHYCYLSADQFYITCSIYNHKTGRVTKDMLSWIQGH